MKPYVIAAACLALTGAAFSATPKASLYQTGLQDLVDTAMATHRFDTFLTLLRESDLTFNFKDTGPFTVFMPTDRAFAKMPPGTLQRLRDNRGALRNLLLYHIVQGSYRAENAVKHKSIDTLAGPPLPFAIVNGHGMVGNAHFVLTNVATKNGMLQGIDTVLSPPSD